MAKARLVIWDTAALLIIAPDAGQAKGGTARPSDRPFGNALIQ